MFLSYSDTDPSPNVITETVSSLLEKTYFTEKKVKLVLFFNNILAGLGILDLQKLQNLWDVPMIFISENEPHNDKIIQLIKDLKYDEQYSNVLKKNPSNWIKIYHTRLYGLAINISNKDMIEVIQNLQLAGDIPEPLRIADMIAKTVH